ncbi:MAG: thioredoxin [Halobacteria archaeon]|nr:thioredoxin [Halobacteria archaeon]
MGVTVKDFHAEWCGPCKKQDPILEELAEEYSDAFTLEKVDVDDNPDIAQQYGVRSVPTIVIEKDGEVVEKFIGLTRKEKLEEALQKVQAAQ